MWLCHYGRVMNHGIIIASTSHMSLIRVLLSFIQRYCMSTMIQKDVFLHSHCIVWWGNNCRNMSQYQIKAFARTIWTFIFCLVYLWHNIFARCTIINQCDVLLTFTQMLVDQRKFDLWSKSVCHKKIWSHLLSGINRLRLVEFKSQSQTQTQTYILTKKINLQTGGEL